MRPAPQAPRGIQEKAADRRGSFAIEALGVQQISRLILRRKISFTLHYSLDSMNDWRYGGDMSVDPSGTPILTTSDILSWERRVSVIDAEIAALSKERRELEDLLGMAKHITARAQAMAASAGSIAPATAALVSPRPRNRQIDLGMSSLSADTPFPYAVYWIVSRRPSGITTAQLKKELEASPLGERLRQSDKGFYHATSRLRDSERDHRIVEYRGYLFTPENLHSFRERVGRGVEKDKAQSAAMRRGSPIIDRVFRTVAAKPGVTAKEIVDELVGDGITSNANSAYNAIARMKKSKELIGDGDRERELYLGPNAPTVDKE